LAGQKKASGHQCENEMTKAGSNRIPSKKSHAEVHVPVGKRLESQKPSRLRGTFDGATEGQRASLTGRKERELL